MQLQACTSCRERPAASKSAELHRCAAALPKHADPAGCITCRAVCSHRAIFGPPPALQEEGFHPLGPAQRVARVPRSRPPGHKKPPEGSRSFRQYVGGSKNHSRRANSWQRVQETRLHRTVQCDASRGAQPQRAPAICRGNPRGPAGAHDL